MNSFGAFILLERELGGRKFGGIHAGPQLSGLRLSFWAMFDSRIVNFEAVGTDISFMFRFHLVPFQNP